MGVPNGDRAEYKSEDDRGQHPEENAGLFDKRAHVKSLRQNDGWVRSRMPNVRIMALMSPHRGHWAPVQQMMRGAVGAHGTPHHAGSGKCRREVLVENGEELLGGEPLGVGADEDGKVLRHLSALDGRNDDILKALGESSDLGGVVEPH